jgi:hypothetical protein
MDRYMIWVEDREFTGWCCSDCEWELVVPRMESTVAALAFNRVAQEEFGKHDCATGKSAETAA